MRPVALQEMPLPLLREGQSGTVKTVEGSVMLRGRLEELGLIPGTEIRCERVAPMGSPAVYRFRDTAVALRRRDAHGIRVIVWD